MRIRLRVIFLAGLSVATLFSLQAAPTNTPVLTLELRDGSHLVGKDGTDHFKFRSGLLGEIKLTPAQLTSIEFLSKSNGVKLVTVNGDAISAEMLTKEVEVESSFGKIRVPVSSVRRIGVTGSVRGRTQAGLVARWSAEGNANDLTGTNNGTLQGGVDYAPGEVGQAFSFDGASGCVLVPASSDLNGGVGGGLTVEGWIKTPTTTAAQIIVEWQSPVVLGGVHMQTGTGRGGDLSTGAFYANLMDTGGGSHMIWSSPGALIADQFQHVALTYDKASGAGTLYVNGSVVAQSSLGGFTPQTSNDFYLGMRLGGSLQYTGLLDEISVYNRALSTAEIQAIYRDENGGVVAN